MFLFFMTESTPSPSGPLAGKTLALGVSGSIAAYKAADLISELRKAGAEVHVVMTESATQFISALTLGTLSRNQVLTSFWEEEGWQPGHIELADKIDLFLVAPATAQQVGNYANGLAPDLLGAIYLATQAPVMLAPAMNGKMYMHEAVQKNLETVKGRGVEIIEPVVGELACGYEGIGKLAPLDEIIKRVLTRLA
jgi:phosphopantothenoylcysteine decarboxylase/phosphopantothenoylcysteine decarboxylase/phosphopantothenate--cysteine ligase